MIKFLDLLDTINTAGVCLIHNKQNVLLLKSHKGNWGLPKGHVRHREETLDGALRELEEETQIKLFPKAGSFHSEVTKVHVGKNKEGGDFCIYRCDIEEQMVPVLCEEHIDWKYY